MKYKLIKERQNNLTTVEQIMYNRGIEADEYSHYLHLTDNDINSPEDFGEDKMEKAKDFILEMIEDNQYCLVVVDCDCDGYTSAAILINYLHDLAPEWVETRVQYFLHDDKTHGISDAMETILGIGSHISYVIIPDASSNEQELHQELFLNGVETLILDHHEIEGDYQGPAILINNQCSDYPNKYLCGAGVVYQLCKYLDEQLGFSCADKYLDLAALGLIADMMDVREFETSRLIEKGLNEIHNPFIDAMIHKNAYSIGEELTPISVAFYVAPFVNAMTRSGKPEEKDILFRSMLNHKAFEIVPSTKRGHKGESETVVTQAIRVAESVKNRQKKATEEGLKKIKDKIEKDNMMENKVLLFTLEPGTVEKNIAGLLGNKISAAYKKPVCILTAHKEEDGIHYAGSARGCDRTGVKQFKDMCESTGVVDFVGGHQGAFGVGIPAAKKDEFLSKLNEILKDVNDESSYDVDFILDAKDSSASHVIKDVASMNIRWGTGFPEAYVAIENVPVNNSTLTFFKKRTNTMKINCGSFEIMKFFVHEDEIEKLEGKNLYMNLVGRCSINNFNGMQKAQILLEDYEIVEKATKKVPADGWLNF
jgi:single-stranded-DNA-specific exonuclease